MTRDNRTKSLPDSATTVDAENVAFVERMLRVHPLTIGALYERDGKLGHGYVLNLSETGVFLSADERFDRGDRLMLRFSLPFQSGAVCSEVVVRWRGDETAKDAAVPRWGFGLEFVELDERTMDRVRDFVERFVELATALDD